MRSVQIIRVLHGMLLIIILLSVTGTTVGHRCYICGEGNGQLDSIFPGETFPPCDGRAVRKQCPAEQKGCSTQTNGTKVTKSCGPLAMNICKTANGVEYCYCQGDLCNDDGKQQTVTGSTVSSTLSLPSSNEDDDEDRNEGSGSEPYRPNRGRGTTDDFEQLVHDASPPPTTRTENSSNSVSSKNSVSNTLTRIVLILLISPLLHIPLE